MGGVEATNDVSASSVAVIFVGSTLSGIAFEVTEGLEAFGGALLVGVSDVNDVVNESLPGLTVAV